MIVDASCQSVKLMHYVRGGKGLQVVLVATKDKPPGESGGGALEQSNNDRREQRVSGAKVARTPLLTI